MSKNTCSTCKDPETGENPILSCEKCFVQVHVLCYGIQNIDKFICSPCKDGAQNIHCALCLKSGGAMKKTTDNRWAHVICTFFTTDALFVDLVSMEPIDITKVKPPKKSLPCVFCNETSGTFTCHKCKKGLHAPCGLANNALIEETTEDSKIVFLGFCEKHVPKTKKGRLSSEGLKSAIKIKTRKQNAQCKNENSNWILQKVGAVAKADENVNQSDGDEASCYKSSNADEEKTEPNENKSTKSDDEPLHNGVELNQSIDQSVEPSNGEKMPECSTNSKMEKVSFVAMLFSERFSVLYTYKMSSSHL